MLHQTEPGILTLGTLLEERDESDLAEKSDEVAFPNKNKNEREGGYRSVRGDEVQQGVPKLMMDI